MNFISLVIHELSAMAASSDVLFVRLLVVSFGIVALGGLVAACAAALRLFADLPIPGWATTAVGVALVVVLQGLNSFGDCGLYDTQQSHKLAFHPALNGLSFIRNS